VSSTPISPVELAEFRAWRHQRDGDAPPKHGWHGMRARDQKLYTPDDWKTWGGRLAGVGILIDVTPGSPAWHAQLRDGTWVLMVNEQTFESFERGGAPVGAVVRVEAFSPDIGNVTTQIELAERPKPSRPRRRAVPTAAPGAPVDKKERRPWLMKLSDCASLLPIDIAIATRLAMKYANGSEAYPSTERLARDLRVSSRTIKRGVVRLRAAGFIDVRSGKRAGRANRYCLTWPVATLSNVTPLRCGIPGGGTN
jgi:biotin operon repressor